jgi:hypothetical protein
MAEREPRSIIKVVERRRTGCLTCRRRRIKCDEKKPICNRCQRANFECEGYEILHTAMTVQRDSTPALAPAVSWRDPNWRQEQLPFFHHFVTASAGRLFRPDHSVFWRDEIAQISFGNDAVHEIIVAIGALHRAALLSSDSTANIQEITRCKVLGLSTYGKALRLLFSTGLSDANAEPRWVLSVVLLCSYFEVNFHLPV